MVEMMIRVFVTILVFPFVVVALVLSYVGEYTMKFGEWMTKKLWNMSQTFNNIMR